MRGLGWAGMRGLGWLLGLQRVGGRLRTLFDDDVEDDDALCSEKGSFRDKSHTHLSLYFMDSACPPPPTHPPGGHPSPGLMVWAGMAALRVPMDPF